MKVSLNWAQYYSNVDLKSVGVDKLTEKIGAQLGAIDEVEDWSIRFEGIVVVKVISCAQHENANKLSVCTVDDGGIVKDVERDTNGHVQVVCGAPNVHAGMLAAWIPPGVTVPITIGKEPLKLESREIRGQYSHGMLASAAELGISEDHSGILEVKTEDVGDLVKAGTAFKKLYGMDDTIIDIENKMFTHRPDLFGILGVAREMAGINGLTFKSPDWYLTQPQFENKSDVTVDVKVHDQKLVPRFMAVTMSNTQISPSPVWMQAGLTRVGIKPINNIVDITNYISHLTGQPMHAYDLDKLLKVSGSTTAKLETRMSRKGDKVTLLGGKQLELNDDSTILITSNDVPVGIGGVMGGADTEVDKNTKNIVFECANFDMYNIRRTAMQYGLFTDAVTRFTKGQSSLQNDRVLAYAMKLATEHSGGQQSSAVIDVHGDLKTYPNVKVSKDFINDRLGGQLTSEEMARLLQDVEFEVQLSGDDLNVTPPFWRTDIEIPEDIVEEIGRLHGYDNLPLELPKRSIKPASTDPLLATKANVRNHLSAAGANEILTYTFVHGDLIEKVGQNKNHAFQVANAISPDLQYYRLSLLPSLLEKVHPNIKQGYGEFALFEINPVHAKDLKDEDGLPVEDQRLAFVFAADDKIAGKKYSGAAYYQAKKYLTDLLGGLGVTDLVFEPANRQEPKQSISQAAIAPFEKQLSAIVKTKDGQFIGELGEFRAAVRRSLKLPKFVAGFELDISQLSKLGSSTQIYKQLSRFPKVEQDITLKVRSDLNYSELYDYLKTEIEKQATNNTDVKDTTLDSVTIFQKEEAYKNITFRLGIASYERTLTAQEVNNLLDKISGLAKTKLGAERI